MTGPEADTMNMTPTDTRLQFVVHQPRHQKSFRHPYEDVEDWMDHFERVATFNCGDNDRKLRNVHFYLEESARTWFENHDPQ